MKVHELMTALAEYPEDTEVMVGSLTPGEPVQDAELMHRDRISEYPPVTDRMDALSIKTVVLLEDIMEQNKRVE